ncbi:transcription-repair coupling factor [Salinivirga cyanobacteriivorans]
MNNQEFLTLFEKHPGLKKTLEALPKQKNIIWNNLKGSSLSLMSLLSAINLDKRLLLIVEDKEQAAQLQNELEAFYGDGNVYFMPSAFKRSIAHGQPDADSGLLRTEALNAFFNNKHAKTVMISYPEALAEKVFKPEDLVEHRLEVKAGDQLSTDFIQEVLQTYGFEFVDFVYQPGQYAMRGSIIDVFSYAADWPYRLDFFGDEVESIRTFDTETQLSKAENETVYIIPDLNDETLFQNRANLTELLGEETLIVVSNMKYAQERINATIDSAHKNAAVLQDDYNIDLDQALVQAEKADFKGRSFFTIDAKLGKNEGIHVIEFDTSAQPGFQKNFQLIAEHLKQNTIAGYKNVVFSTQQSQIDRLTHIFNEMESEVQFDPVIGRLHEGFIDHQLKIACYTDHQIFDRYQRFHLKQRFNKKDAISLKELTGLHPGDYVVHIDHGVGQFGGLEKIDINGKPQEAIKLIYKDNDVLYVNIHSLHRISKYKGKDNTPPRIHKLGSAAWAKLKSKTKSKVKDIARDLIKLYAARRQKKGYQFGEDTYLNEQLEASFIYEDTPDQLKATQNVKADMEADIPMDRLVCGDVGFGKTEVAIRAAFKAVCDSKQVAVLVPTTILAFQHFKTFSDRLKEFPVRVEYISRMRTAKDQRQILKDLANGEIDIIIGTHRLVGKDVQFRDLGLLINDEEQKFGVSTKEKIRAMKADVDTLTMTATPIPRTLQFSLMGARDLSIINTAPPNRYPITTELHPFNEDVIREAIDYEISRNGQVFFIHNRVQNIADVEAMVKRVCPKASTVHAHGQMEGRKLEKTMLDFIDQKYDVLVATTIIESGLDIPNANTIIINDAQNYGLSDLHQLRGRVGRSNKKAFAYLLTPPLTTLTPEARRRLQAIEMFSELGSGFNIAMQDLDIRGAGNLLGAEQSGFIADVGLETYQQILDEAMHELKETEFSELFKHEQTQKPEETKDWSRDCQVDTDFEVRLPDSYIANVSERIKLYRELDEVKQEADIQDFEQRLNDRFGKIPGQVKDLFDVVRMRMLARKLGFEKIVIRNGKMLAWFISNKESSFYESGVFINILGSLQENPNLGRVEEKNDKLRLVFTDIKNVTTALEKLKKIM